MTRIWRKYEGLAVLVIGYALAEWLTPQDSIIGTMLDVIVSSLAELMP